MYFTDGKFGLTADRVREVLNYDKDTGIFTWRVTLSQRRLAGQACGELKPSGYVVIGIDGHRYRAHRLAWLYVHGEWPSMQIDHRDLNRSNNKFDNLRLSTQQQNTFNTPVSKNNRCGFKGVYEHKGRSGLLSRWCAKINVGRRQIHLGTFDTPEEASRAYEAGARLYAGEFARAA